MKRDKPDVLTVPDAPNITCSMDFKADCFEKLRKCAETHRITIQHIQPGQPQQNAYVERYNRTVRHEWLDQYIIESIEEAQDQARQWFWIYNDRPNMGIGGITPAMKLKLAA